MLETSLAVDRGTRPSATVDLPTPARLGTPDAGFFSGRNRRFVRRRRSP
jgi:hypothetical protein